MTDFYDHLGKAEELADSLYDRLRKKYYWRDWLVVVYSDVFGSKYHWRLTCNRNTTTLDLKHWKERYNIIIASVPSDKRPVPFTSDKWIRTCVPRTSRYNDNYFKAKYVYDTYMPGDAKNCKYEIVGVVKRPYPTYSQSDREKHKVAVRAPENRKFHQRDDDYHGRMDIFVLG